jgi:transglutaminase-like putative cysteine protease
MSLVEAVRKANRPGPPEDSIRLRTACFVTVVVAIGACASTGDLSRSQAFGAVVLIGPGMAFSYRTRSRPPWWIKVMVAVGAVAACVWFFHEVVTPDAGVTSVEGPLTVLMTAVLVLHSFHVPARRDLMFSIGASSALMAVAGAQAIDLRFGFYVIAWAVFGLWALTEIWQAASGGLRASPVGLIAAFLAMVTAAVAVFLVLPAPDVAARVAFLSKAGFGGSIGVPGALAGDSGSPAQLARAGTRAGPSRVGGYLGFADSLDTALRGALGNTLVMQVRAQRPSYWVGETFNTWDGQDWTQKQPARSTQRLNESSPIVLPVSEGDVPLGEPDLQTFYVASSTADLVFHADSASELWFPRSNVYYSSDGTIVSPIGLGQGSIYTVQSQVEAPSPEQLRVASVAVGLPAADRQADLQLPHAYPLVHALAESVTARDHDTYDRVQALISWMGRHTRYSLNIPPLHPGTDTVDEFLFGDRVGFCEQISTSLTVMLRTLGIPSREAVGYVPGSYDPLTDLYQVHADDAHAWVQVWFPDYGWQSFDPTASVPSANPTPGTLALHDLGAALRYLPWVPLAGVGVLSALGAIAVRVRRTRPATWAERVARTAERAGRRAGRPRLPWETFVEYATILDLLTGRGSTAWRRLASSVEGDVYGGVAPTLEMQRHQIRSSRRMRVVGRWIRIPSSPRLS